VAHSLYDRNPSISIITPTYNSAKTLADCLESIKNQDYRGDIEIIIADGGSTDSTLEIARKYTDNIYPNPLKTGEAGKAAGVKHATNEIIALIDSDNILPSRDWLSRMTEPFQDREIAGTEPLYYTYRKEDGYITRYCAMLGMNDPLCLFLGNYDRMCMVTGKWTEMPVIQEDKGNYLKIELDDKKLPTIGANGFLVRRDALMGCSIGDYLFDIDIVYELITQRKNKFAKVKVGIVHLFSGDVFTFIKKQRRRIKDYAYYKEQKLRKYPWGSLGKMKLLKFIVYTIIILPLVSQLLRGYWQKQDRAWWFHIPACWITLNVYGFGAVRNMIHTAEEDRSRWNN
jgi:glycosyltransferase involved in cell wall biosynthesis